MNAELLEFPKRIETAENPQRALENAVVRLLKRKPFYGHLLLGFRRRLGAGTHAIGVTVVNGTPTLNVDLSQFQEYPALNNRRCWSMLSSTCCTCIPYAGAAVIT